MTDISYEDIYSLKADQLQELLNKLMCAECYEYGISLADIRTTMSDRTAIKDGGADGLLYTENTNGSPFFFCNSIIFQAKATEITSLKSEIDKEHVKNFIKNGGGYVLFCNKYPSEGFNIKDKEDAFKQEIAQVVKINVEDVKFKLFDHSRIKDWIERHPAVKRWFLGQQNKGCGVFRPFEKWKVNLPLQSNAKLEASIKAISDKIKTQKIFRIEGLAGTGKTRQVYEAIKSDELLQNSILYLESPEYQETAIIQDIQQWINNKEKIILIVDDCSERLYHIIRQKISAEPNIQFVSMDYVSSESNQQNKPYDENTIELSLVDEEIIENMLKEALPDITMSELKYLAKICHQNPRMAELISSHNSMEIDFSYCIKEPVLSKMRCGHDNPNEDMNKVLQAFSLFDYIIYSMGDETQIKELAKLSNVSTNDVLRYFNKLRKSLRVIQSNYEYHRVIPKVFAFQMALNWLHNTLLSEQVEKLSALPDTMKETMISQLKHLNRYSEVQELAAKLAIPFAEKEMINTPFGSECFYQLANTNPEATLKLLQKTFSGYTRQDYLEIRDGRRNIVRSLQVMAFHKKLFLDAVEILLNLADAENENWGNNATGEFCKFFKLYLGGTQLSAIERLKVIKDAMTENNINKKEICLKALDNGLQVSSFTRMGGPEQQGAVTLKDWQPDTYDDMWNYIGEIFNILETEFSKKDSPFVQKIKDIIGRNLRSLIVNGYFKSIEEPLIKMFKVDKDGWEVARVAFNHLREFEIKADKINSLTASKIEQLEHMLDATNLLEEIKFKLLSIHSWDLYGEEKDNIKDRIAYYAKELQKHYDTLKSLLSDFGESDNTNVFWLGKTLSEKLNEKQLSEIITLSVEQLKAKKINSSGDASFLAGIFSGLDEKGKQNIIFSFFEKWLKDETLAPWIIIISRGMKRSSELYQYWIKIINEYKLDDFIYRCIPTAGTESYTGEFQDISLLLDALEQVAMQGSIRAIIQSLHYCWLMNKGIPAELRPQAKKIINNIELLSKIGEGYNSVHEYECTEIWESLYQTDDETIKSQSISSLIEAMLDRKYKDTFVHQYVIGIIKKCLERGDSIVLREVGKYLSERDDVLVWLEIYLSGHFDSKQISWVSNYNIKEIEKFMSMNENCSGFIARSIALFDKEDNINPYFKYILEHFADNHKILEELYFNICNFSWVGPIGGYYLKVKNIIVPYLGDKNANLRSWANGLVEEFDRKIKDSDKREKLMQMGIYR